MFSSHVSQLAKNQIQEFIALLEVTPEDYQRELRAALGPQTEEPTFLYCIEKNCFSWKRQLSGGLFVKRGHIVLKEAPPLDTHQYIVERLLEKSSFLEKLVAKLEKENKSLKTDHKSVLNVLEESTKMKETWERELYGQFINLLNAKKERIQTLEAELDLHYGDTNGVRSPDANLEDPYGGDTDVDSDSMGATSSPARSLSPARPSPEPSSRRHHLLDCFESPEAPVIALPKRLKVPKPQVVDRPSTRSSSPSLSPARAPISCDTAADTQDLLDQF